MPRIEIENKAALGPEVIALMHYPIAADIERRRTLAAMIAAKANVLAEPRQEKFLIRWEMAERLTDFGKVSEVHKDKDSIYQCGMASGLAISCLWEMKARGQEEVSISKALASVRGLFKEYQSLKSVKALQGVKTHAAFERKTWRKYKPVSHLYAAMFNSPAFQLPTIGKALYIQKNQTFFFSIAEHFRIFAEGFTPSTGPKETLFSKGLAWSPPEDIQIANVDLNIPSDFNLKRYRKNVQSYLENKEWQDGM